MLRDSDTFALHPGARHRHFKLELISFDLTKVKDSSRAVFHFY